MRWRDMSFKLKLGVSFGFILLLMAIIGAVTYRGIDKVETSVEAALEASRLETMMAQREVDHLLWVRKVDEFLMSQGQQLQVQTDHKKCKMGAWLYGSGRADAESQFPQLAPMFKGLEIPHSELHHSAVEIQSAAVSEGHAAALQLYHTSTLPALERLSNYLHDIEDVVAAASDTANQGQAQMAKSVHNTVLVLSLMGIVMGIGIAAFFSRYLSNGLTKAVSFADRLAEGDFTQTLRMKQKDEFGRLSDALDATVKDLGGMIGEVSQGVDQIHDAFNQLDSVTKGVSKDAESSADKAVDVSAATTQMSSNMDSVAAASEETTTNMTMVSDAAKEMAATVNEIAENTEKARTITLQAVSQTQTASGKVDRLGISANQIGKVTEVITEISEQTNLLALNATIEAARAGEAGKGFAVVANEIKELAKQTADATQEIKQQIDEIQAVTGETVAEIGGITKIIDNVNDLVAAIATAVEEQSATTQGIADNVDQAATGINEVNERVADSSLVATDIADNITGVSQSSTAISKASGGVSTSVAEMKALSVQLQERVQRFRIRER